MWKRMAEGWVWGLAFIDLVASFGIAQLLVRCGWRWSYLLDKPLDASNSIVSYALFLGSVLPFVVLVGYPIINGSRFSLPSAK